MVGWQTLSRRNEAGYVSIQTKKFPKSRGTFLTPEHNTSWMCFGILREMSEQVYKELGKKRRDEPDSGSGG